MWRHRIWRTGQWKQEDGLQRQWSSTTEKEEQELRLEIIKRAEELHEWEDFEGGESEWEETVKQLIQEASNLPGQREESVQCKRCGKERLVLNQQNWERQCIYIYASTPALPGTGKDKSKALSFRRSFNPTLRPCQAKSEMTQPIHHLSF